MSAHVASQPALLYAPPPRVRCVNGHVLAEVGVYAYTHKPGFGCRQCQKESGLRARNRTKVARVAIAARVQVRVRSVAPVLFPRGKSNDANEEAELAAWRRSTVDGEAWLKRPISPRVAAIAALFDRAELARHDQRTQAKMNARRRS